MFVSVAFVTVSTAQSEREKKPGAILGAYILYPIGQTAAKFGDRVRILVNSTTPGGAGTCDATLIGGSATDGLFDDGDYVIHRDWRANDGTYTNEFLVRCTAGYKRVPFTVAGDAGSVIIGVDTNPPNVTQVRVIYPVGQTAAKEGDDVRILAKITDHLRRKPVDVVMALDNSGSMAGAPVTALVTAANGFVDYFEPCDRIAAYCFGPGSGVDPVPRLLLNWTPMDPAGKAAAKAAITTLLTDTAYNTPIWDTIYDSVKKAKFEHLGKNKPFIVAMTDGANNVNNYAVDPWADWLDPPGAPGLANITLDVYTIGLNGGGFTPATELILKNIAWTSHGPGMYFFAPTPAELNGIYQAISGVILGGAPEGILDAYYNGTVLGGVDSEPLFDDGMHADGGAYDEWFASDLITLRNKTTDALRINVSAWDVARNNGTNYTYIKIDNTAPIVSDVQTIYETPNKAPTNDGGTVHFRAKVTDTGTVSGIAGLGVTTDATSIGGDSKVQMKDAGGGYYDSESVTVRTNKATGVFMISVTAMDIAHNSFTQYGNVSVDNANPEISLIAPFKDEYMSGTYTFRVSVTDNSAVSRVEIDIAGTIKANMAYDSASGEYRYVLDTNAIPDTDYTVKATVYDVFSLSKVTPVIPFHVDNSLPQLNFVQPTLDGVLIEGKYIVQVTASDNKSLSKVQYKIDSGEWKSLTHSGAMWTYDWQTTAEKDGSHNVSAYAADAIGHEVQKSVRVRVDNHAPVLAPITMPPVSPPNVYVKGDIPISVGASDAVELRNVTIQLNNGTETQLFTNGTDGVFTYVIKTDSFPSEQALDITVTAYDMLLHKTTVKRTVIVDYTPPSIFPTLDILLGVRSKEVMIRVNVTDLGIGVDNVQINIDGKGWMMMTKSHNYTNAWEYKWSTGVSNNGMHYYSVRAVDKLGNTAEVTVNGLRVQNQDWNYLLFIFGVFMTIFMIIPPLYIRRKREKAAAPAVGAAGRGKAMPPQGPHMQQVPPPVPPPPPPGPMPQRVQAGPAPPPPPPPGGMWASPQPLDKKKKGFFR
jgi:hypothetical protein